MARDLAPRPAGFETEEAAAVAGGLGAAAAAELVVVFVDTPIGAALHALFAHALVLQWVVGEPATYRRCLAALALVPLTRIVSMALVLPDLEPAVWGTIAAAFVLVSALLMARAGRPPLLRSPRDVPAVPRPAGRRGLRRRSVSP